MHGAVEYQAAAMHRIVDGQPTGIYVQLAAGCGKPRFHEISPGVWLEVDKHDCLVGLEVFLDDLPADEASSIPPEPRWRLVEV